MVWWLLLLFPVPTLQKVWYPSVDDQIEGCYAVSADLADDHSAASCGGKQCPNCYQLDTSSNAVTLTITNCHFVNGVALTGQAVFMYTFYNTGTRSAFVKDGSGAGAREYFIRRSTRNVDFDEFVRWMWMQPVDAKEKMVGSTAVARQLLQEIADRLDADHVPYDTLFSNADVSRDGLLSRDELSRILLAYLPDVTSSVLTETFNLCDMDNSGWINVQEFVAALRREASSFKAAVPSTVDVEVSIPPGWRYGMQLPVTYDGLMYYVDVPAGCTVGSAFTTTLQRAA